MRTASIIIALMMESVQASETSVHFVTCSYHAISVTDNLLDQEALATTGKWKWMSEQYASGFHYVAKVFVHLGRTCEIL
jgi:hypothetical protein